MNFGKPGQFVIKGKATNFKGSFFEFGITSYFDNEIKSVPVNSDGSFEQIFPVNNSQDIYPYLNDDEITFTVKENDTIMVDWDEKNFSHTFRVTAANPVRNMQLQVQYAVIKKHQQSLINLKRELYEKWNEYTDEQKYQKINKEYNQTLYTILSLSKAGKLPLNELAASEYFTFCSLLNDNKLLPKYQPIALMDSLPKTHSDTLTADGKQYIFPCYAVLANNTYYKYENEWLFAHVATYRNFISSYICSSLEINSIIPPNTQMNNIMKECYLAKANLASPLCQDWLITNSIIKGFSFFDFSNIEAVYLRFIPEFKTAFFKEQLSAHYQAIKTLKPGNTAPAFSLKDENGKMVALSDFKGKVVYIDFWGVYCGSCLDEIVNYAPKIYEFYKDKNVVFLNICVDVNEGQWKGALKKYNFHGVNLFAEGWTRHPVCKAYNVTGIPHYILINKDGSIANNNATRPSGISGSLGDTEIDRALQQ